MVETVVTDNRMSAELKYPGANVISKTMDVIDLPLGCPVILHRVRIGSLEEGALKTARILIERGDIEEAE